MTTGNHTPSVLLHCWLGYQTCKNIVSKITYKRGIEWDVKPYTTQLNPIGSEIRRLQSRSFFQSGPLLLGILREITEVTVAIIAEC